MKIIRCDNAGWKPPAPSVRFVVEVVSPRISLVQRGGLPLQRDLKKAELTKLRLSR